MRKLKMKVLATAVLLVISGASFAAVAGTPAQPKCLQTSLASIDPSSLWYTQVNIAIKNNCSNTIELDKALVSFASHSQSVTRAWSKGTLSSSVPSYSQGNMSAVLQDSGAGQPWGTGHLTAGGQAEVSFGVSLSGKAFDLAAAQQSLQVIPNGSTPTPNNGQITVNLNPANLPTNFSGSETIKIASGQYSQTWTNSSWNSSISKTFSGLAYGDYTISASVMKGYSPIANPSTVNVQNPSPNVVNVVYQQQAQTGAVTVTLPQNPLGENDKTVPSVQVTLTDTSVSPNQIYKQNTNWATSAQFNSLPSGDKVSVNIPVSVTNGKYISNLNGISNNPAQIVANSVQTMNVTYGGETPVATVPVQFSLGGLSQANATLNLVDRYGNNYSYSNLGNNSINESLPINNAYTVSANAPGLSAAVSPSQLNVGTTSPSTPVTVNFSALPASELNAYWAGWMGYQFDLQNTYGNLPITAVDMAFGNYVNDQIDTSVSGWFSNVPAPNSQIQPSYQNWTTYAYTHPKVNMVLSLGGASFSAMWQGLTSDQAAQNFANAIVQVLNTQYPVYAPASSSNPQVAFAINSTTPTPNSPYGNSHLLGYASMGGVDLDVEVSGAHEMAALTPYLVETVKRIHQQLPNKTISFATFSVGADPANACTVPGSAHCGEALPLIQAINAEPALKNIVSYNVMAYDADKNFVIGNPPLYQKALQNYVNAVGSSSQVILGLDLQSQWGQNGNFTETCEQLGAQATWAYQNLNTVNGTFLWEIGDDSNVCKALPALQAMSIAMGKGN